MNFQQIFQIFFSWFFSRGLKIAGILLGAYLLNIFLRFFVEKAIKKHLGGRLNERKKQRIETLLSIFGGTLRFVIYISALLMILPELGISVAPLLASVGIAGLAIGMASRDIVSDFIAGLFIILENQYEIGDKIKISGLEGEVKEMTLRKTIIKDENGVFHLIPNSQIKIVSKKSV